MSRLSHIKVKFGEVEVLNSTLYAITLPGTPFGRLRILPLPICQIEHSEISSLKRVNRML